MLRLMFLKHHFKDNVMPKKGNSPNLIAKIHRLLDLNYYIKVSEIRVSYGVVGLFIIRNKKNI